MLSRQCMTNINTPCRQLRKTKMYDTAMVDSLNWKHPKIHMMPRMAS